MLNKIIMESELNYIMKYFEIHMKKLVILLMIMSACEIFCSEKH